MKDKKAKTTAQPACLRPQDRQTAPASEASETGREVVEVPKGSITLIKDRCKSCGFCIEFCPKKVLEFSSESNAKGYRVPTVKYPDKCILCGFCSMYCPDFAIYQTKNKETKNK